MEVNEGEATRSYLNALSYAAFENVYVILKYIALHPAMGTYLNMVNNDAARASDLKRPARSEGMSCSSEMSGGR